MAAQHLEQRSHGQQREETEDEEPASHGLAPPEAQRRQHQGQHAEAGEEADPDWLQNVRQQHAVGLDPPYLRRLQVRHHDDRLADQILRLVRLGDPGYDLTPLLADVELQSQQLVGTLDALGLEHDDALAAEGEGKYGMFCVACHGPEGKGNPALGAPNLTDDIWLYGGSDETIRETILQGRNGMMPAHGDLLGPDRTKILAAYVYSLSQN